MPLDERAAVRRLLDRLGLGARPGEVDDAVGRGFDATLTALLTADPGTPDAVPDLPPLPSVKPDDPRKKQVDQQRSDQRQALAIWWLDRMATVGAPATERLTWFWHGHWATSEEKVDDPGLMLAQNQTLRTFALTDFRSLAAAMVADPALIRWLDGQENKTKAPNENLARELMELFTLGVNSYTEGDVRESARALTGWTLKNRTATFQPTRHDAGVKTILDTTEAYDTDTLVGMLVTRPDSARFMASRLWFRLVSPAPPPPEELDRLVAAYGPGTDIRALLRAVATSTVFHEPASTLVKAPVEWVVGLARAVGRPIASLPAGKQKSLLDRLSKLGQVPFRPPNVGGWPAGSPWLTPAATVHRLAAAQVVLEQAPVEGWPSGTEARLEWARSVLNVDAWSPRTAAALGQVAGDARQLLAVGAVSPEFVVSG